MLNSWLTEYKLGLGSFETDNFEGKNEGIIWLCWLAGTFLIQITFLNMIIAIMGNTFDKVMDKRQLSALKERINIMQDYRKVVTFLKLDKSFKFMAIVKPISLSDIGEDNWDGRVTAIR